MFISDPTEPYEDPVSYKVALNRSDKQGKAYYTTYVKWSKQAERDAPRKVLQLYTIGEVEVMLPVPLPKGYQMQWHDSWEWLALSIYDKRLAANYSFDYLDSVIADKAILYDLGIKIEWELIDYDLHPGYFDYIHSFEDPWADLRQSVESLYEEAANEPLYERGVKQERRSPPTLVEVLERMLERARQQ